MQLWQYCLLVTAVSRCPRSVATAVLWQPTLDILTGYISPDQWHAPVAATTVFIAPDDGRRKRPKHVE